MARGGDREVGRGRPDRGDGGGGELADAGQADEFAVQVRDESALIDVVDVAAEELAEAIGGVRDGRAVPAHVRDEEADDAAGNAGREIVNVAALGVALDGAAEDPGVQAGHVDGVIDGPVPAPHLEALHGARALGGRVRHGQSVAWRAGCRAGVVPPTCGGTRHRRLSYPAAPGSVPCSSR